MGQMATQDWTQNLYKLQTMIERENDKFEGQELIKATWKDNAKMFPMCQWEDAFMDGDICVRYGQLGEWKFECRLKTEDNKIIEVVTKAREDVTKSLDELRKDHL